MILIIKSQFILFTSHIIPTILSQLPLSNFSFSPPLYLRLFPSSYLGWFHFHISVDSYHLLNLIAMISIHVTLTYSSCLFPSQPFWPFEEYDSRRHPNCQPHLDYLAPEYALTHTLDTAADLFPLGVLTYALFNEGRPIFHNNQDFGTFKRNCCEVRTVLFFVWEIGWFHLCV